MDTLNDNQNNNDKKEKAQTRKLIISWRSVISLAAFHVVAFYGLYLALTKAKWQTCVFTYILYIFSSIGVTAGAHRLWSHNSYKVKLPLRIIILVFYTTAFQGPVYRWVIDHRVHHKHCDTDADPHNSTRGFFFSHMGWLVTKRLPELKAKSQTIDMSDIDSDPLLCFQKKYYNPLVLLFCYIIPTYIPTLWGEQLWTAFCVAGMFRHIFTLHMISFINSAAHMWGVRSYDKSIRPAENTFVSLVATGEGFHNYHHTFPWDYKAAELGGYSLNYAKLFIDLMALIGWAYDLKTVSADIVEKRVKRTGDGTHPVWGWNDKEMSLEDKKAAIILH